MKSWWGIVALCLLSVAVRAGPLTAAKIAFTSNRDGNTDIFVMNPDGSGQTNVSNNGAADLYPTWSPDGTRIAFWSNRDGNAEIYVMNANGSGQTNVSNNGAGDYNPAWSPRAHGSRSLATATATTRSTS